MMILRYPAVFFCSLSVCIIMVTVHHRSFFLLFKGMNFSICTQPHSFTPYFTVHFLRIILYHFYLLTVYNLQRFEQVPHQNIIKPRIKKNHSITRYNDKLQKCRCLISIDIKCIFGESQQSFKYGESSCKSKKTYLFPFFHN